MNKLKRVFALLSAGALALAAAAACAPEEKEDGGGTKKDKAAHVRICYDNIGGGYVDEALTAVKIEGAEVVGEYAADGTDAEAGSVAAYADGVFTAVGAGTLVYRGAEGELGTVEVVPAYVTDPGNQYRGTTADYDEDRGQSQLGNTHDPSLIETTDRDGLPVYYIFSTGWNGEADATMGAYADLPTYGNAIHVSYDGMRTWEYVGKTFDVETRGEDFVSARSGRWLYEEGMTPDADKGSVYGFGEEDASWWAPDIVEKPDGSGYWLYTCVVDGSADNEGISVPGDEGVYARACILLYESETLDPGSFKPVLVDGEPAVLMQSTIRRGETEKDVNGIDPQIIYDPEGNMYMAYGSFGSGNYLIELDPETGLRKDGKGWQTHENIRSWVENDIQEAYAAALSGERVAAGWKHDYYGTNISIANMEAPVIARHDNVTTMDENGEILAENKTYYYSMHSYDGLADNYQMWGGRSESVWGEYRSTTGGAVYNDGIGSSANEGNKYMGAFTWHDKSDGNTEIDIILPGHNDLYTTASGVSLAAYITRADGNTAYFVTQLHQYYLNSYGEIVINPNRYGGEMDRAVTAEELFAYTQDGKFKMVVAVNRRDTDGGKKSVNVSRDVTLSLNEDKTGGNVYDGATTAAAQIGTWKMYGNGYIKFEFTETLKGTGGGDSGETVFYGVVRPAWLGDQNRSGFTVTCLGQTQGNKRSMSMFMNNYSTLTGEGLAGEAE